MGKRSTKRGKYLNPIDQTRKEERKKELKKNKKQRMIVRTAALKKKDPLQILAEMENIDKMEYNTSKSSFINENVLREKRRKLKEKFNQVMKMYEKDELNKYHEIKRAESEYEKRRFKLISYFEAVRTAQQVSLGEIPLPVMTFNIPLPDSNVGKSSDELPVGLLKKPPLYTSFPISGTKKRPPGVPPGLPPTLSDEEEDDDDDDNDYSDGDNAQKRSRKLIFTDTEDSGKKSMTTNDVDNFMREIDEVQKRCTSEKHEDSNKFLLPLPIPSKLLPPGLPLINVISMPYQRPTGHLPPGPPPGRPPMLPPGPPPGLPFHTHVRLPLGPPPGIPPRMIKCNSDIHNNMNNAAAATGLTFPAAAPLALATAPAAAAGTPNILSAEPQLINRNESQLAGSITEAKPKMRYFADSITQFLPTSIRLKKGGEKKNKRENAWDKHKAADYNSNIAASIQQVGQQTKDEAYMQFMQEIEGLL